MDLHDRPPAAADAFGLMLARKQTVASSPDGDPKPDGRRMRSERTKQAIVDAYLEIVQETSKMPTAADIAARAGYAVRSVFERFPDLTALTIAALDHALTLAAEQAVIRGIDGDRQERLQSHVEMRSANCERGLPLWRAIQGQLSGSEELRTRVRLVQEFALRRVELMYRPELETLSAENRQRTLVALEAITQFDAWGRMRIDYGLPVEAAREIWIAAIDRLLPPTPAVS